MASRQNVKNVPSPDIQGADSWVKIKRPTMGELQELMAEVGDGEEKDVTKNLNFVTKLLAGHVMDWNWVDDDGKPLPLPPVDPDVVKLLTDEETIFLSNALTLDVEAAKKKKSG